MRRRYKYLPTVLCRYRITQVRLMVTLEQAQSLSCYRDLLVRLFSLQTARFFQLIIKVCVSKIMRKHHLSGVGMRYALLILKHYLSFHIYFQ